MGAHIGMYQWILMVACFNFSVGGFPSGRLFLCYINSFVAVYLSGV